MFHGYKLMVKSTSLIIFIFLAMLSPLKKPAIIKADDLVRRYTNSSDTTYVINFWATWCSPCIKELPYFEKLNEMYKKKS